MLWGSFEWCTASPSLKCKKGAMSINLQTARLSSSFFYLNILFYSFMHPFVRSFASFSLTQKVFCSLAEKDSISTFVPVISWTQFIFSLLLLFFLLCNKFMSEENMVKATPHQCLLKQKRCKGGILWQQHRGISIENPKAARRNKREFSCENSLRSDVIYVRFNVQHQPKLKP